MQLDLKYFQLSPNEALQEIKLIHNSHPSQKIISTIIHLNLDPLLFQKSYQFFDMTHIFPLDQIHSCTHLCHHI